MKLLLAGLRIPLHDVGPNRLGEQHRLLTHVADTAPHGADLELPHVLAIGVLLEEIDGFPW